ncbi:MAG: membrane-bound lytic murein transglycosylase D, partial [Myxococcota bacterium]
TGPGRKYYQRWLSRSTRYRPMMYEKLDAAELPRDLVYLSMIESGYATHAYSSAAAVGLWQFIAPTGKQYELRIDWWVDDRRDPMQATDAAIGFLGDLYRRYDHWYLAWAAYNGGPGRVSKGISRNGTRDFWELVEHNAFPRETDNYVPKLLAAAIIGKHPDRYGFTGIEYQDAMAMDAVTVGPNIGLDVLARCAGITLEEFQELNPHLRRWALPPDPAEQVIYVPQTTGGAFLASLEKVPAQERLTYHRHKVQSGDSLGTIAAKYGTDMAAIQSVNRITNPNRIYVGMELVIPASGAEIPPDAALTSTSGGSSSTRSATTSSRSASSSTSGQTITHTVARGEALSKIAETYGVKTSDLMRWNQISNANRVNAGQKLKVHTSAAQWNTYTVRSGDSLSRIAAANGCTTAQLKSWNDISGSTIYAGQKLKIKR